jgi:hypothetical protein
MSTFAKILVGAWAFFWLVIALLLINPQAIAKIPHFALFKPYFIILFVVTVLYSILWLFRLGMRRARKNPSTN